MKNPIAPIISELYQELRDLECEYHNNPWLSRKQLNHISQEIDSLQELLDILYLG